MTNPYRAMCAELVAEIEKWQQADDEFSDAGTIRADANYDLAPRARALLAQPVPEGPKPVVDYSRVPEIATEAQIRSAAQYLVKKRNCDGDLISAIEYAIARWGRPTLQPVWDDIHYVWELHDDEGERQAGGSAITLESAEREGNRYLQAYAQDGPHKLIIERHCVNIIEEMTNG